MEIIAIAGKAGHGKDTFALMVKDELEKIGKRAIIVHNADYLKLIAKEYYGWNGMKDEEGRTLLQKFGTENARKNNPDIWVNVLMELAQALVDDFDYMIIPDVRFPNEIDKWRCNDYNVASMVVVREADGKLTEEQQKHASETSLDSFSFDFIVHNDKGLSELTKAVEMFIDFYVVED